MEPRSPREMSLFYFFFNLVYRAECNEPQPRIRRSEVLLSIMFFGSCKGRASRVFIRTPDRGSNKLIF